jgi:signal recognition particle receptor subunit alpha
VILFEDTCYEISPTYSVPSLNPDTPQDEQKIARKVQALKDRLRGRGGRRGGRGGRTELPNIKDNNTESE